MARRLLSLGACKTCVPTFFPQWQKSFHRDHKKPPWAVQDWLFLHFQGKWKNEWLDGFYEIIQSCLCVVLFRARQAGKLLGLFSMVSCVMAEKIWWCHLGPTQTTPNSEVRIRIHQRAWLQSFGRSSNKYWSILQFVQGLQWKWNLYSFDWRVKVKKVNVYSQNWRSVWICQG